MKRISMYLLSAATTLLPAAVFAAESAQCTGARAAGGVCGGTDLEGKITSVVDVLFYIAGALAVLVLVYGGIRYITSTGDPRRIQAAKDTIIYGIIGLVVVILARMIVAFVISKVA